MTGIPREVLQQRPDRKHEIWKARLDGQTWRCGVCLTGVLTPELREICSTCGAVVTQIFYRDRRTSDRLPDEQLSVEVFPNAAGGHLVRVLHRPSNRYASASHREKEEAIRQAKRELARSVARVRRRERKGMSP